MREIPSGNLFTTRKNLVLYTFQRALADVLTKAQLGEPERHQFHRHITIGRTAPVTKNYHALKKIQFSDTVEVRSMEIMKSVLKPEGSVYSIIKSYRLKV